MRPVVLSVVDGKNFLLGSFDTTNFQAWWKSEPFPGAVDIIQSPIHVYGQYHVCIVKMTNGTYSIYRTKNMGKSWVQVYNTSSIIYTLTAIDYGWIVGSTSTGWIESKLDSGFTWSVISSFAPRCKTVINISDDILFAHDGSKIWRSTDYAKTWSVVLNKASWYSQPLHPDWSGYTFAWSGYASPALAGVNQTLFVGFGPYLVISEDLGATWTTHPSGWNNSVFNSPNWGNISLCPQTGNHIEQLILTEGVGQTTANSAIMMRNRIGNTIYYMYSGPTAQYSASWIWQNIFSNNSTSGTISAYDVLQAGSPLHDILAVITTYDSNNNPVIMKSLDGGLNWTYSNVSNVTVYEGDPAQEIISGIGQQTFDEEYWTTYTWMGMTCHNAGRYIEELNKTVRGISFDVDFLNAFQKTKSYPEDLLLMKVKYKTCPYDVLNKKANIETFTSDSLLLKYDIDYTYLAGGYTKKEFLETITSDITIAERTLLPLLQDATVQKTCDEILFTRAYINGQLEKTYEMGIKIVDNHVDEIMNSIEKFSPQFPDVKYPDIGYVPFDSRTQKVSL